MDNSSQFENARRASDGVERYPLCGPDQDTEEDYVACISSPVSEKNRVRGIFNCTGGAFKFGMQLMCSCKCHNIRVVHEFFTTGDKDGR